MRKVLLYGMGECGRNYVDSCIARGVTELKLVDSNEKLWGTEYRGLEICGPDRISWKEYEWIVIAGKRESIREISDRLITGYQVPGEKIVPYYETVILSEDEIYNWGDMVFDGKIDTGVIVAAREIASKLKTDSLNDLERFFFRETHRPLTKWMHYFEAYDRFFSRYRGKDVVILEIGVFKGGSLQMWKDYFKTLDNKVRIYGIDIDPECKRLEEDGITIFIGSQEDRDFLRKVKEEVGGVDILIDDGGHTMRQQIVSFEELFDLVREDGIYLCEDLHTSYMEAYGGGYRGDTFLERSKDLIDFLHAQYSETDELTRNRYSDCIKFITYCDSMIFIEKRRRVTRSLDLRM